MLSTFNILNYLDKLEVIERHKTWILAKCPVCGEDKLKININGAYSCYANECHRNKQIQSKLKEPSLLSLPKQNKPLFLTMEVPELIPLPFPLLPSSAFLSKQKFVPSYKKNNMTIYKYGEGVRVYRWDLDNKKTFATKNCPSIGSENTIFRKEYVGEGLIIVEGEKNAETGQALGLNCVSVIAPLRNKRGYIDSFRGFKNKIKGVIVIEDNDETGKKKAKEAQQAFTELNIPAKIVNLATIYDRNVKGWDLSDAVEEKLFALEDIL